MEYKIKTFEENKELNKILKEHSSYIINEIELSIKQNNPIQIDDSILIDVGNIIVGLLLSGKTYYNDHVIYWFKSIGLTEQDQEIIKL